MTRHAVTAFITSIVLCVSCAPHRQAAVEYPERTDRVTISVSDCAGSPTFAVRPWTVGVSRASGVNLQWRMQGAESMRIEPKGDWGQVPNPAPPTAGPDVPINVIVPPGLNLGNRYSYTIVLRCGGREYRIDPDIIIAYH